MQFVCYHNGEYLFQNSASISTTDLGFTRGYAAFELIRTYGFAPFYLREHLERFKKNGNFLLLDYPNNVEEVVLTLIKKNNEPNLVIRLYLSEDESGKRQFLVLCDPIVVPPIEQYENGISVITTELMRHFHPIKSTCYLSALLSLKEAAKHNAEDAIFLSGEGDLLELTKSNFFAVMNETLYTPNEEILLGITRSIVIDLAKELHIKIEEARIPLSALPTIEEAFSTSTIREILPISKINSQKIPIGPITKALKEAFKVKNHPLNASYLITSACEFR
jgi:branched-chain amino acid aminotransferase